MLYGGDFVIKALLFDLDGTLVNSLADLKNSTNFALGKMGFPIHETECYKYFVGDGMAKLIERALPENCRNKETIETTLKIFLEHYKQHYVDETLPYDGILDLLEELSNFKLAIISNKNQEMANVVVEKLLGDKFQIVCGKRENYPTKPDPKLTLEIIAELGVKPNECVFIGDSGMDMAVAKNAGCIALGVLWGFRKEDELRENGADYIVSAPSEILNQIKNIEKM